MSHQTNINGQGAQNYIGKSALNGAEHFTLSKLGEVITKIFSSDDSHNEDLILAGKLAEQAGQVKRSAIWAAYRTKQPQRSGLGQGDYFLKYFGLEPYQTTKEIARAKVLSELPVSSETHNLNDSCLDELDKINKKFDKDMMCGIYEKCCLRISNENELRITKKLIQKMLKLVTTLSPNNRHNQEQPKATTVVTNQETANTCTTNAKQETSASNQETTTPTVPQKILKTLGSNIDCMSEVNPHNFIAKTPALSQEQTNKTLNEIKLQLEDLNITHADLLLICRLHLDTFNTIKSYLKALPNKPHDLTLIINMFTDLVNNFLDDINNPL